MNCRICGNFDGNRMIYAKEMMFGFGDVFPYFECARCGCLQIAELPLNLAKYYPKGYYSYRGRFQEKGLRQFLAGLRDRFAVSGKGIVGRIIHAEFPREDMHFIHQIPGWQKARVLDVGCGAGSFLYALREFGMQNLLGVDPFNEADIEYRNGLVIQRRGVLEVEGIWDLVTFHHSFEHIPDPFLTLEKVSGLLADGGLCVIRMPTVPSYAWAHYGVNWVQLDAPRHFFIHSTKSLSMVAQKAGMVIEKVIHDSTAFQFWGSEKYARGIPLRDRRSLFENWKNPLFSRREMSDFRKRAEELNVVGQGDQAAFFLRKGP